MPLYEYECSACGNRFETLVNSSNTETACPSCNSADVKKLLSVFAAGSSGSTATPACGNAGCGSSGFG